MDTIIYHYQGNLYINLTNKCPCACTFCLRNVKDEMDHSGNLWLKHEPSAKEVLEAIDADDISACKEIVFCGFGEPTERIDTLIEIATALKKIYKQPIRVNTNGLGSLIHKKDITPMFRDVIDCVSVSLNTPDAAKYNELTRSIFGEAAYQGMLAFTGDVKHYVKEVVMTTVSTTLTEAEEEQCRQICERLGVAYRIRPYEDS